MKHHHSSGKYRLLKRVIMMCLTLILVCSMSISAFAVDHVGRAENGTTQSVQMTDNQKGEAATRQKSSEAKTKEENTKKSDSESKTKDSSEEQKTDSKDTDNKEAKEKSTEKDAKEDSEKNTSKEEKNSEKNSEETTDASETTTKAAEEKTTEAATEKTTEGKDSKEAASKEKAAEETQAEDNKNKEIAVTSNNGTEEVQVGNTISLSGSGTYYSYSHSWSSSNEKIATVTGSGSTGKVTGVAAGTVTITHTYGSYYGTQTETWTVNVTKFADNYSGTAAIYYLSDPAGDPWSNDTGEWAPKTETGNTLARINTTGATWESGYVDTEIIANKNIKSNVASYITSWPDGSTGSTWTVKRDDSTTGSYFTYILNSIWDNYRSSVAKSLGINATELQKLDITEITLTPRKISRANGGQHDYHIDCALSVKSTKTFTAKFWVKEPGDSEYTQVDAKNYLKGNSVNKTTAVTIGSKKTVDGVTYVLDGWYPENTNGGAYGSTKIADNKWNYSPSDAELADGTVNFYAHYTPATTSINLKKLVTGSMGDKQKKFKFTISIQKDSENATFKVGSTSETGSAIVQLANNEESSLTEIPVGATVTITEDDYSGDNGRYTTTYKIDGSASDGTARVATISNIQAKDDATSAHEIVFTNNKEAIPDTGITLDSLPFITLLALSIAGGIFYLLSRYKKRFI